MATNKTQPTRKSVSAFLATIADAELRADCRKVAQMMKRATGASPKMWGPSIVGFGKYHYKYASGHEGDMCLTGFAPRKPNLVLYIMGGFPRYAPLMKRLGKVKTGVSCVYIRRLSDVDQGVLEELIGACVESVRKRWD